MISPSRKALLVPVLLIYCGLAPLHSRAESPQEIPLTAIDSYAPTALWTLVFIEYFIPQGIRQSALKTTEEFLSQESQVGSKVTLAEKLILHLFPDLFCWLLLLIAGQSHSFVNFVR